MTAQAMLALLQQWRSEGWLRALDLQLARFIHRLDPDAPASLLLASALLAQLEAAGHSCLPLADVAADARTLLAWPPDAAATLAAALHDWPAEGGAAAAAWLRPGAAIAAAPGTADGDTRAPPTPLLLDGGRLYLRRYWRDEARVAQQVRARVAVGSSDPASALGATQARALFARLFAGSPADTPARDDDAAAAVDWQQVACAVSLRGRLTLVTGGPGTGKTHTAARMLLLAQALHTGPQPLRVALAAPTGKAAARLRRSIADALQALAPGADAVVDAGGAGGGAPAAAPAATAAAAAAPTAVPAALTLHALLGSQPGTRRFRHHAADPLDVDLLFVDEASMVHLELMAALLDALPPTARLVLLGDPDQLASVEAGAVLGDLCPAGAGTAWRTDTAAWVEAVCGQRLPQPAPGEPGTDLAQQTVVLQTSHRFSGPIADLAHAVRTGDGGAAAQLLGRGDGNGAVAWRPVAAAGTAGGAGWPGAGPADAGSVDAGSGAPDSGVTAAAAMLAVDGRLLAGGPRAPGYAECLAPLQNPSPADAASFDAWALALLRAFDRCRVLCALREGPTGVSGLNAAIERTLGARGLLRQRRGDWYPGRPLMVTRNDPMLGVFNGDVGLVLAPPPSLDASGAAPTLRCYFADGDTLRSVAVSRLAHVETAFAMTVHKSQGSEFDHVLLVLPARDSPVLTRELVYTAVTRARRALTVLGSDKGLVTAACGRRTRRLSGLAGRLGRPAPGFGGTGPE